MGWILEDLMGLEDLSCPWIFREAKTLDLPEPVIEEIGMRVRFTVYLNEPATPSAEQSRKSSQEKRQGPVIQSGVESGVESEVAHQVMDLLRDTELSKSEIARALGKSKPSRYLNDLVKKLLKNGYVAYTFP